MQQQQYFTTTAPPSYVSSFAGSSYPQHLLSQQPTGIAIASPVMSHTSPSSTSKSVGQKRKQVKNACVNCQKACKKCDEGRPCQRCIKYGLTDTCVDSTRKERKKGIKRGPYKRRQHTSQANGTPTPTISTGISTPQGSQYSPISGSPNMRNHMSFNYTTNISQFGANYDINQYNNYSYPNMTPSLFSTSNTMLSYPMVVPTQSEMIQRAMSASPPQPYSPSHPHHRGRQPITPVPSTSTSSVGSPDSDQEEDGSKLNILSQLCSAVLDHSDPKNGSDEQDYDSVDSDDQSIKRRHSAMSSHTPPPSPGGHTRTSSYDSDYHNAPMFHSAPSFGHDSPHTYIGGHIVHRNAMMYGTPNSSPSGSPTDSTFSMPASPKVVASTVMHQSSSPAHFWPLPPLQSVVAPEHLYHPYHANVGNGMHVQGQHQESWGLNTVAGW